MKTYKVKNYKGNILESLKKFQEKYPDIKISKASVEDNALKIVGEATKNEAVEDGGDLKIKAEAVGKKVYVLIYDDEPSMPTAICTSIEEAERIAKAYNEEYGDTTFEITEYDLDEWNEDDDHYRTVKKI